MSSDLRHLLIELKAPLSETQIKNIFYQMVKSIEYCHGHHVIHRDVKMENFLIDLTDDHEIIVKLADFGIAYKYRADQQPPTRKCGSLLSRAPEMLTAN